jgi:uncharacterized protein YciI
VKRLFAVIRSHGPGWRSGAPLEDQQDWPAHAAFMDALTEEGVVLLGGPLGEHEALLIVRAGSAEEIEARLAKDPWTRTGLLRTGRIEPWTLRLGSLPH